MPEQGTAILSSTFNSSIGCMHDSWLPDDYAEFIKWHNHL